MLSRALSSETGPVIKGPPLKWRLACWSQPQPAGRSHCMCLSIPRLRTGWGRESGAPEDKIRVPPASLYGQCGHTHRGLGSRKAVGTGKLDLTERRDSDSRERSTESILGRAFLSGNLAGAKGSGGRNAHGILEAHHWALPSSF